MKTILQTNPKSDTEKLIFELSDETRGAREVAKLVGVASKTTVLNYWKRCGKLGIFLPVQNEWGRYRRICSLEEVGSYRTTVASRRSDGPGAQRGGTR